MGSGQLFDFINNIITTPLGFIYIILLCDKWRYPQKTVRYAIALYLLILAAADAMIMIIWGIDINSRLCLITLNIASVFIFSSAITKYRDNSMVFIVSSACMFIYISDFLAETALSHAGMTNLFRKIVIMLFLALLVCKFFRKPFHYILNCFKASWMLLSLVPLSICALFSVIAILKAAKKESLMLDIIPLGLCIVSLCIYVTLYYVFRSLQKHYELEKDYSILQTQILAVRRDMNTFESIDEQLSLFRHDMRHFMQLHSMFLDNHDEEGAKEVIEKIVKQFDYVYSTYSNKIYTGNSMLDATLSFFAGKATEHDIDMVFKMEAPQYLEDVFQFAVVLSNAIENALNACLKMSEGNRPRIQVSGGQINDQYFLEIANTFEGCILYDEKHRPIGTEPGHGYGTKSIDAFARRHNAVLLYLEESGWFKFRLIF